jgi:hypothetical protein
MARANNTKNTRSTDSKASHNPTIMRRTLGKATTQHTPITATATRTVGVVRAIVANKFTLEPKGYSPECVEEVFSEDEMRRPTPYAVP